MAYIDILRQLYDQSTTGKYAPLELGGSLADNTRRLTKGSQGDIVNQRFYDYLNTPNATDFGTNKVDHQYSPIDYKAFKKSLDYINSTPELDFIDVMGRVISPGTKIYLDPKNKNGGYYEYNPTDLYNRLIDDQVRKKMGDGMYGGYSLSKDNPQMQALYNSYADPIRQSYLEGLKNQVVLSDPRYTQSWTLSGAPGASAKVASYTEDGMPLDAEGNAIPQQANPYVLGQNPEAWKYVGDNKEAALRSMYEPTSAALFNASIIPWSEYGDFMDMGLTNAIKGIGSAVGGVVGAIAGGATSAGSSGMTISEAVQNGATVADLADMGFTWGDIIANGAMNPTATLGNELTGAGLSSTLSNGLASGVTGGLGKYITSGGDAGAAIKGALGGVTNGLGNYTQNYISGLFNGGNAAPQLGEIANSAGGANMGLYDGLNYDPMTDITGGFDVGGLDVGGNWNLDTSGLTGGGGNWYDNINWGSIATNAIPAISGLIGGIMGNNAQTTGLTNASNALINGQNQQAGIYAQQRQDFMPYYNMGMAGLMNYGALQSDPNKYIGNSSAYQWQKDQTDKNMNRQLAARGRSNSTYGMNSLANAYGNLAAGEYDKAYNRTMDQIKVGQGAAGSIQNAGNTLSGAYGNTATGLANNATQQGVANSSLYSGLGALPQTWLNQYNTQQNSQNYLNLLNKAIGG